MPILVPCGGPLPSGWAGAQPACMHAPPCTAMVTSLASAGPRGDLKCMHACLPHSIWMGYLGGPPLAWATPLGANSWLVQPLAGNAAVHACLPESRGSIDAQKLGNAGDTLLGPLSKGDRDPSDLSLFNRISPRETGEHRRTTGLVHKPVDREPSRGVRPKT